MSQKELLDWQTATHEALVAINAAVRAYQNLLEVAPKVGGSDTRPFAEINLRYE